jgi:3-oxoacyl-[acyl-carrier protein] reductase
MREFEGRTLLITGAVGGIGSAICRTFSARGAAICMVDSNAESLQRLAHELDPDDQRVTTFTADASQSKDAADAVQHCITRLGRLDFLVPAAAIYVRAPFHQMSDQEWRETMAVNLDGVFYICRSAVPAMGESSSIVTIASDGGHAGSMPGYAHYGASKGGILGLTRTLAKELAPKIRVNTVSPGMVDTPMVKKLMLVHGNSLLDATPMRRLGAPREIADVVAFLCSNNAAFITGEAIHVNGGAYIAG